MDSFWSVPRSCARDLMLLCGCVTRPACQQLCNGKGYGIAHVNLRLCNGEPSCLVLCSPQVTRRGRDRGWLVERHSDGHGSGSGSCPIAGGLETKDDTMTHMHMRYKVRSTSVGNEASPGIRHWVWRAWDVPLIVQSKLPMVEAYVRALIRARHVVNA